MPFPVFSKFSETIIFSSCYAWFKSVGNGLLFNYDWIILFAYISVATVKKMIDYYFEE